MTFQSDVAPLRRIALKHARDALVGPERVSDQWATLRYLSAPDYDKACREFDDFASLLERLEPLHPRSSPSGPSNPQSGKGGRGGGPLAN